MSRKPNRQRQQKQERTFNTVVPRTPGQERFIDAVRENNIVLCNGPQGTGKTYLSSGLACEYLLTKMVKKVIITRPTITVGVGLGFLPGDAENKISPFIRPIVEELSSFVDVDYFLKSKQIVIEPLCYLRGVNLKDCFCIMDEAQNATLSELILFITRVSGNSKLIISGDTNQSDLNKNLQGGLQTLLDKLKVLPYGIVGISQMTKKDIVRNPDIAMVLEALGYDK